MAYTRAETMSNVNHSLFLFSREFSFLSNVLFFFCLKNVNFGVVTSVLRRFNYCQSNEGHYVCVYIPFYAPTKIMQWPMNVAIFFAHELHCMFCTHIRECRISTSVSFKREKKIIVFRFVFISHTYRESSYQHHFQR